MDPNTPWIAFKNNPPNGSMTTLPWRWLWKTSLTSKYMGFSGSSLGDDSSLFEQLNQVEPGFFSTIPQKDRTVFSGCWAHRLPSGKHTKSYWKWPFIVALPIKKMWFSIVTLVYQRVCSPQTSSCPVVLSTREACRWDLMRMLRWWGWWLDFTVIQPIQPPIE